MYISTLCIFVHYVYLYIIYICTLLEIQGALRPSSISTFNCGFISEHLLFVQYKTKTKKVCGFHNIFLRIFKIFQNKKLLNTHF